MNRTLAVADLHGMYPLWRQVIEGLDETDILYMLGDSGDRGHEGWKIIKEALADPRVVYIRGNHDQMILDSWREEWRGRDFDLWMYNGGWETFDNMLMDERHEIYLTQLARTKLYHCYENKNGQNIHLSHAGFTLMENDEIPNREELLWDREHIEDTCSWWPETNPNDYVVHGHTYCANSLFKRIKVDLNDTRTVGRYCHEHKICIDGRAYRYGRCAVLDLDTLTEEIFRIPNIIP